MISRKSTRLLADVYINTFSYVRNITSRYPANDKSMLCLYEKKLYDFMYEHDYAVWVLQRIEKYTSAYCDHFRKFILALQTGEMVSHIPYNRGKGEDPHVMSQQLLVKLAKDIIKEYETRIEDYGDFSKNSDARKKVIELKSQLELDGYVYRDGNLFPVESSVIDEQEEQSYLEKLVDLSRLNDPATIKHHIRLAEEDYVNDRWSNSIGNSRHFLEAILAQVLERVSTRLGRNLHPNVYRNATTTRDHLEREGLLTEDEKETIRRIYGLLSNIGGHAYIAEKDQARLMWHLALTCSQFVLLRYEGFVTAHP